MNTLPNSAIAAFFTFVCGSATFAQGQALTTRLVTSGLDFPVFVTAAPGDTSRLFVVEKNSGRIRVVDAASGQIKIKAFLNTFPLITNGSERGLLGLAFHPDYQTNRAFYVCYTDLDGDVVLARYLCSVSTPDLADGDSAHILFEEPKPFLQHNAGMLQFGPDGYLYMSIGDGGSGYDPFDYAQNLDNLKGKLLRIAVDGSPNYSIPSTNPFVSTPGGGWEGCVYGLCAPWRFSIDSVTGNIFIGDVGQELREEIDFIASGSPGGKNFGWRCLEGDVCHSWLAGCDCQLAPTYEPPIHVYSHLDNGTAVVGGYVYRGCAMPALQGTYFFADYGFGRIFSLRYDGAALTEFTERTAELDPPGSLDIGSISSFGVDARGEMYIVDYSGGEIFQIVPSTPVGSDCNGNTIPDGCEIAGGAVPDTNADGIIDFCVPGLSAQNLYLGALATFQFSGALPNEFVYFGASLAGAGPSGFCLTSVACISLLNPFFLLTALPADGLGTAAFSVYLPPDLTITTFAMQAVVIRGAAGESSLYSNVLHPEMLTPLPQ
jgi:glucose/arabinose dehydrogenase